MGVELTYNELFQDKLIFESIGRKSYYEDTYPDLIKNRNKKPTRFIKYVLNYWQSIRKKPKKKGNLLFLEHKFENIARNLSKDYNIYLLHDSIRIYREYYKQKYFQYFYRNWLKKVDRSFITHDMSFAKKALIDVQNYLIKNNIDIVFTGNDKMFMEKLILMAAQNIGVPTVVIQHGIYTDEISFAKLKTADTAENFWTWSQYIKDCYLKRYNKAESSVKVIGYPFTLLEKKRAEREAVLFLGNNYRKGSNIEGVKYIDKARTVLEVCNELGIPFHYRPHPGEIIDSEYGEIGGHTTGDRTLLEDLDSVSIVIGDVSSAMVEAVLCGKNVIQIVWNELSEQASKDPMYSFTIKVSGEKKDIMKAINQCMNADLECQIDEYYIFKNPSFYHDIYNYIDELLPRRGRL